MRVLKKLIGPPGGPMSRRTYILFMIGYWLYTIVWLAVALFILLGWDGRVWEKLFVILLWMTLVPAGGQFESYSAYLKWRNKNASNADEPTPR